MTIVSPTPSLMPSILSMVQRVKRECGLPEPTTLVGTTDKTAIVALDALNDAAVDIYSRKRWEWQESLYGITLVAGTAQYALPADFMRMAQPPEAGGYPIVGLTEEEWYQVVPAQTAVSGSPQYYTVHGYIFEVWPVPSSDYITQYPILPFVYYRQPPQRLDGSDDAANLNLPPEFVECLITYGKFKVKAFLEYPDATGEIQLYEKLLFTRMNAGRSMRKAPRLRQSGAVRSKIWS